MAQQETYKINVESNAAEVTREVDEAVKDLKHRGIERIYI